MRITLNLMGKRDCPCKRLMRHSARRIWDIAIPCDWERRWNICDVREINCSDVKLEFQMKRCATGKEKFVSEPGERRPKRGELPRCRNISKGKRHPWEIAGQQAKDMQRGIMQISTPRSVAPSHVSPLLCSIAVSHIFLSEKHHRGCRYFGRDTSRARRDLVPDPRKHV